MSLKDLLDEASRFISFDVFVTKFKVKANYLEYYKAVSTGCFKISFRFFIRLNLVCYSLFLFPSIN